MSVHCDCRPAVGDITGKRPKILDGDVQRQEKKHFLDLGTLRFLHQQHF